MKGQSSDLGGAGKKMRSLAKIAPGEGNVTLREVDVPTVSDDSVLVAVKHVGICGSDLHIYHDTHPNHPPVTLGHEFSGVIASVGRNVKAWAIGVPVVSELHAGACGQCRLCKTGNFFACPHKHPIGWWTDGAYADFITVPAWLLHRVPDGLSLQHATLTEPLAVSMNVFQRARIEPQSTVAVIGPGPIGLLAALAAKHSGAGKVIVVGRDSSRHRLELALQLGLDHTVNSSTQDVEEALQELSGGLGADLVIEAGGSEGAVLDALKAVRKLGTIAALGVHAGDYRFPWNQAVFKAVDMVFSFSANYLAFEQALKLLRSGSIPIEKVISGHYPLEEWKEAFQRLERRDALKLVLDI